MSGLQSEVLHDMATCELSPSKPNVIIFDTPTMVRYHVVGDKPGSRNGFWRGFSDGRPAGIFGSWKTGQTHLWIHGDPSTITDADRERIQAIQRQREEEQAQEWERVSEFATAQYSGLPGATGTSYTERKRIEPLNSKQRGNSLILALQDWDGKIWSTQTIYPDGVKRMLKGGKKRGLHILVRENPSGRLLVCEGYATAVSLAMMDPNAEVIAAIDAQNMKPVAEAARARFPEREIVLAGDHDPVGIKCAEAAARAIGGLVLIPETPGMDWNDYFVAKVGA
ncbi:toprim domain-containing protein [Acidithiobacillus sp.]|uniref:toprim domain-containing protein n=1 Tax=Acidithiobacillus sp. TaxID=1872118 RepID=UPI0026339339|nr:toprim domain-containing protein [Acidithiobacillus sp.]MDD2749609.1 toprim domain-containing protein [Acidithiobacillus sp.]MDD5280524.1 toprim domain-containing protein [Acidithiobacillus sp.]